MSELKKPTIEGLIEKLLEEKHIQENEAGTVQALLGQASNGLNKEEIFTLVTKLNDKLDAHTSDLITPNGLNYSVFESEVKTVSQVIKKEKVQREKSQAEATVEPSKEKKDVEKTPQEKEEIERQQRIADNRKYIDHLFDRLPGISKEEFSQEDIDDLAETMDVASEFFSYWEKLSKTMPKEKAKKMACKKYNITEEKLNSQEFKAATMAHIHKVVESSVANCKTPEDAERCRKNIINNNRFLCASLDPKFLKSIVINGKEALEMLSQALIAVKEEKRQKKEEKREELREEKKDRADADVSSVIYADKLDIEKLLKNISAQEITNKKNRSERKKIQKKENQSSKKTKEEKRLDEFYDKITRRYLEHNKTISELYEELKDTDISKQEELEFEDFLDAINDRLMSGANGNPIQEHDVKILMIIERKTRRIDMFYDGVETAEANGATLYDNQKELLNRIDSTDRKSRKDASDLRKKCALRVGISSKENFSTERTKIRKKEEPQDKKQKLEADIERMSRDRNEIIRIAKEKGITTDEASKIYFSENEKAFKAYSLRERRILIGKDKLNKKIIEPSKTLKKIRVFEKTKNDELINIWKTEIEHLDKIITDLEKGFDNPKELNYRLKELEKAKKKLKKAEKRNERLEKREKPKNAIDTIEKKIIKKEEEKIFEKFIKTGKNAVDIFEEIMASGNEYNFTQSDMLRIIREGARKYLQKGSELDALVENEELLFTYKTQLTSLQIKKENAEQKNLDDWINSYNKEIEEIEEIQRVAKNINQAYKNRILRRKGIRINNNIEKRDEQTGISQNISATESKRETEEETSQTEKKGLAAEELKVAGVKPNVKAVAKKMKVTPKRIKEVFSKIVGLRKSKQGVVEQTEQENNSEEKINKTSSETGAR